MMEENRDNTEAQPSAKFALNMLHSLPLNAADGSCKITRNGSAIPLVLPCHGERFEFASQRYEVRPSDGSHGEDAFTHLHFTVQDAPDDSARERWFWYRAVKAYWLETELWFDPRSFQFSDEEKQWAEHLRIRGMIGLGLKKRGSELAWGRYGIKDEKRLDREQNVEGHAYGDGADSSAAGIPAQDFVKFARTVLARSSGQADQSDIRHKYASEFLPRMLDQCWAMQVAAFVPDEESADGHPAHMEIAKTHGKDFVARCKNIAESHTGDSDKDFDLFLEAVGEWRGTRGKKANEEQRKLWHLFQWDMDYALLNIYSHVAKWLMELPDVKKLLDDRSLSYNYFAHTFQKPLLYHVPSLHPFWNLCLGSWPRAKVVADAASDIITPEGETLETDKSKEAAERLNGLFVAALVVYDRLVTERPMQRSTVLGNDPFFEDGGKHGEDAAESDVDDEQTPPEEEDRVEANRNSRAAAGNHGAFPSESKRILEDLEEKDATPGSRCTQPRNTEDGGWGFDGDESSIPDPEGDIPSESLLGVEVSEIIKGIGAEGGRDVLIALDRHYHSMTIAECAQKYECANGTITKRAAKGLSIMRRELERRNLSLQALL